MINPKILVFSPDSKILIVSDDKRLIFYDIIKRQSWNDPLDFKRILNCAWSGNGKLLAVIGEKDNNFIIKIINMDMASWPEKACRIANRNLTRQEWRQYLGDIPYQKVCPELPEPEPAKTMLEELEMEKIN